MKTRILLFFFLGLFQVAFTQAFTVSADKKNILIGEQLHLQLEATFQGANAMSWFSFDSIAHFEILERSPIDTVENKNGVQLSQKFLLTSWDSGSWQIPSFVLAGSRSAPIKINVSFTPFDPDQPYHDVKDVIDAKKPIESKWYWYLLLAIILLLLFLLFFPKEKKKSDTGFLTDPGAYQIALKQLEQLQSRKHTEPKIYYTDLVHIFRTYLKNRKNIQSFSKTTDDLAIQLKALTMNEQEYRALLQTLRMSDLVKFARFMPITEDNQLAVDTTRNSIINIEALPHAV